MRPNSADQPLLELRELEIAYRPVRGLLRPGRPVAVVRDLSFSIGPAETVALVGESGSGKTTIARAIAGLIVPRRGSIVFDGQDITVPIEHRSRELHRAIQYVFQNPDASLNPRRRVGQIIGRPLEFFFGLRGDVQRRRVLELLDAVHLDPSYADRFPGQLSGGERQRVAIAQALAAEPRLILCDEVVSALDVSVQAAILDLLRELQAERGIAYLFIAHDLAVVRWLAHRVVVLFSGEVMEAGRSDEVFAPPYHPYTEVLLASVPEPDPARRMALVEEGGAVADRLDPSAGCPFARRCPRLLGDVCRTVPPPRREASPSHWLACHIELVDLAGVGRDGRRTSDAHLVGSRPA